MMQRENISLPGAEWLIGQLLTVANTGIGNIKLGLPAAETLAATIAGLFAENAYLKKLLDSRVRVVDDKPEHRISISFGPGGQYVLHIPVQTDDDRRAIAGMMAGAAAKILYELENKDPAK
jgi:hypothetical protein